jgi:hypothetical protein
MPPSIRTIGGPQLQAKLEQLKTFRGKRQTGAAFRAGVAIVRESARQEAPSGDRIIGPRKRDQGKIKQAIISYGSKRRGANVEPAAFARVNVLKGRIKAPHAHLVHDGTKERRPKRGKFLVFPAELGRGLGRNRQGLFSLVFARRAAGMRANPFFRRGVDKSSSQALEVTIRGVQTVIERLAEGKATD